MKKIKLLIALVVMSLLLVFPMSGCMGVMTAQQNMGDGMLGGVMVNGERVYDAIVFKYYSNDTMVITNRTNDDSFASQVGGVVKAGTKNYTIKDAEKRQGNDIMKNAKKIVVERNVTGLGSYLFYKLSNLESIEIGPDVMTMGENLFMDCFNLKEITVDPNNQYFEMVGGCLVEKASGRVVHAVNTKKIVLGEDIKSIDACAFAGLGKLVSVDMSASSVKVISDKAFRDCKSLTSVKMPSTVTNIGDSAFFRCGKLENVDFHSLPNLTNIGQYAFYKCASIDSVRLPAHITTIGTMAFTACESISEIFIDEIDNGSGTYPVSLSIGNSAFYDCNAITKLVIDDEYTFSQITNRAKQGYIAATVYTATKGEYHRDITVYVRQDIIEMAEFQDAANSFGGYFKDFENKGSIVASAYAQDGTVEMDGKTYVKFVPVA